MVKKDREFIPDNIDNEEKKEIMSVEFDLNKKDVEPVFVCNLGFEKCKSHHQYGPAIRDHYLLHFIVNGKGYFENDNFNVNLEKGKGFLILPNELTYYQADISEPWEYCWMGINGTYVLNILDKCGLNSQNPIFSFNTEDGFLDKFLEYVDTNKSLAEYEFKTLGFMFNVLSDIVNTAKTEEISTSNSKYYLFYATNYINTNYTYSINVTKIANIIGIDRTYLYKLFKKYLNISPEQYIMKTRLDNAKRLLLSSNLNISQVALSTGFSDASHFSVAFKNEMGISPKKFKSLNL